MTPGQNANVKLKICLVTVFNNNILFLNNSILPMCSIYNWKSAIIYLFKSNYGDN